MNLTRITLLAGLGLAAISLAPASASAAFNGWTDRPTTQRAGPGPQNPNNGFIPAGQQVRIYGCLRGVTQCDVSWRGNRGWVPGSALNGFYRNKRVPLLSFGPQLGLPFITFNFGYWDDHYRGKPFFKQRGNWDKNWKKDRDDGKKSDNWKKDNNDRPGPVNMPKKSFDNKPDGKAFDNKPGSGMRGGKGPKGGDECRPGSNNPECRSSPMN
jgi:uncharacterized protein YraI